MPRRMAPSQDEEESMPGDTYHVKSGRQQGKQVMKQIGDETVEERRRAVASRKHRRAEEIREEEDEKR